MINWLILTLMIHLGTPKLSGVIITRIGLNGIIFVRGHVFYQWFCLFSNRYTIIFQEKPRKVPQ